MTAPGVDVPPLAERDAADERRLLYRRARHAFLRGPARGSLLDEPRRNRPLLAGIAIGLAGVVMAGVIGLFSDRPPAGWNRDGTLLTAAKSGERFFVVGRSRRAVVNDTSLRLAMRAPSRRVTVSRSRALSLKPGAPLGVAAWPSIPPRPIDRGTPVVACARAQAPLEVLIGTAPPPGDAVVLVTNTEALWLVAGGRRFRIGDTITAAALGYDPGAAVPVPAGWLALVPEGPPLEHIALPAAVPAPPGAPPYLIDGALVSDASSGRLFVMSQGTMRPVLHATALRLVFGVVVPPPVPAPPDVISSLPQGPPLGVEGQPGTPPPLTDMAGRWVCAADHGNVTTVGDIPTQGLEAEDAAGGTLALRLPPGRGLVASTNRGDRVLLASGHRFPATSDALSALGLDPDEVRPLPAELLDAISPGPPLRRLPV